MKLNSILATGLLSTAAGVLAHPEHLPRAEVHRRGAMSKRCAGSAGQFNQKRYAQRMAKRAAALDVEHEKRQAEDLEKRSGGNTTVEITVEAPYYDVIQNDTCVLTPEVTEGPYVWPRSQTLRQDMTEDQPGIPFTMDVGVMDMATCEPLEGVLVSFWHCNATGSYSSFTGLSPNTPFPTLLESMNITEFDIGTTDLHTDDTTWLRGMWPTNSEGMMEMQTIFPGFYTARSIHIHAQVYTDWTLHSNGTVSSGNIASTGQLYFDEALEQKIMALQPYASHTEINRTTNADDTVYPDDIVDGYNPIFDVVAADGKNVENGMIGYITVGVDTTAVEGNQ